ncbi:hypothetical protein OKW76_04485 [Sphingomonas sp. S1-29]|uniref:hypothetical protein n=1 Tax=Sphingomonas sp. S1-29 TaxID=2991074 RepID=UPI002240AC81|nr:hypothetical protein [Sphingomonas sp. S1-29]UZK70308.1 hypothetical protein OKW76_04485 [Sphingomonas sp. S1-29]
MTLPALSLDDLTYEDLRALAMRNIPAASGGRWTHHAPVDAGVTLLELFAFLLEQQLFVLDQVPDSMVGALLALLGQKPEPTKAAHTVLVRDFGGVGGFVALEAGEAFRPVSNALLDLVFTLKESALLPPVTALKVAIDGVDASAALAQRRTVPLLANLGGAGWIDVDIQLNEAFRTEHVGKTLALALVLDGTGVAPEWAEAAVEVPAPGPFTLRWKDDGAGGTLAIADGTGGVRRSGLIRFAVPAALAGRDRLRLTLGANRVGHAEPPRLAGVHLGAAIAHHRWHRSVATADPLWPMLKAAIDAWLPISGQTLALPPELAPVFEDSIALRLTDRDGVWQDWAPVADLTALSPEDRKFTFDRTAGRLAFGDGYAGRVPAPAGDIELAVDLGGGPIGNHPSGMAWRGLAEDRADVRLRSAVDAIDGADAESLVDAQARVASSLAERHRAVTAGDYVALVESTPGLASHRAHVVEGWDPHFPCRYVSDSVTVFVVPRTGSAVLSPKADDGALAVIRARLNAARMLTTRVFVVRPAFRPVELTISLSATAGDTGGFEARLKPIFAAYLHPAQGGPDRTGWPFGRALRPSEMVRVAQAAVEEEAVIEQVSIRLADRSPGGDACIDATIDAHDLVYLSKLRVKATAPNSAGATL